MIDPSDSSSSFEPSEQPAPSVHEPDFSFLSAAESSESPSSTSISLSDPTASSSVQLEEPASQGAVQFSPSIVVASTPEQTPSSSQPKKQAYVLWTRQPPLSSSASSSSNSSTSSSSGELAGPMVLRPKTVQFSSTSFTLSSSGMQAPRSMHMHMTYSSLSSLAQSSSTVISPPSTSSVSSQPSVNQSSASADSSSSATSTKSVNWNPFHDAETTNPDSSSSSSSEPSSPLPAAPPPLHSQHSSDLSLRDAVAFTSIAVPRKFVLDRGAPKFNPDALLASDGSSSNGTDRDHPISISDSASFSSSSTSASAPASASASSALSRLASFDSNTSNISTTSLSHSADWSNIAVIPVRSEDVELICRPQPEFADYDDDDGNDDDDDDGKNKKKYDSRKDAVANSSRRLKGGHTRNVSNLMESGPALSNDEMINAEAFAGNKHFSKEEYLKMSKLNSLDYHLVWNQLYRQEMLTRTSWSYHIDAIQRWALAFVIGLVCGVIAFTVHFGIETIQEAKLELKTHMVENYGTQWLGAMLTVVNIAIVLPGTLLIIYVSNAANSSGIPFVKSYQNGVRIPQAFNLKTLSVKILGVISAVASNMPLGPEGPMIHIGGMIGGGVSQSRSKTLGCELPFLKRFRNDRDRRDFISAGSACGVAAAFSAPIGGCLFAMEETASFWSHSVTWRTLFSCIIASFTIDILSTNVSLAKGSVSDNLTHSSVFAVNKTAVDQYRIWELIPFACLGMIGGILGSIFIKLNSKITALRIRYVGARPLFRVLEVIFLVTAWTWIVNYVPDAGNCRPLPKNSNTWEAEQQLRWTCPEGQFNGMASLLSHSQTMAFRMLLRRNANTNDPAYFEYQPHVLVVFTIIYYFGSAIVAGSTLVSGLMVPMLLIGAGYGRLMGVLLSQYMPAGFRETVEPGIYALVGATSFFGGVSRMTISLSVIMLEITDDMRLLLPIVGTAMIAKWVGDYFSHALYDLLIGVQSIPFLESEPAELFNILNVSQVMSRNVKCFMARSPVRLVCKVLHDTQHHGFPVIESYEDPRLRGVILRSQLLVLLSQKVWRNGQKFTSLEFQEHIMNFKGTIEDITLNEDDFDYNLDLSLYYNQSPFSVSSNFALTMAFRLFRTMGLRHLPVVDSHNRVVGMITRKDLVEQVIEAKHEMLLAKHDLKMHFKKELENSNGADDGGSAPTLVRHITAPLG